MTRIARFALATLLLVLIVLISGPIMTLAHGGDLNLIHACVRNNNGTVRIVGANAGCNNNETAVDWGLIGPPGSDGQACWDLNGNGLPDVPAEDTNNDGQADVADCKGADGLDGMDGAPGLDGMDGLDGQA